jgi:hypothetical protein
LVGLLLRKQRLTICCLSVQSYSVVKFKKFKMRQERVITIAPDIITNHSTKIATTKKVPLLFSSTVVSCLILLHHITACSFDQRRQVLASRQKAQTVQPSGNLSNKPRSHYHPNTGLVIWLQFEGEEKVYTYKAKTDAEASLCPPSCALCPMVQHSLFPTYLQRKSWPRSTCTRTKLFPPPARKQQGQETKDGKKEEKNKSKESRTCPFLSSPPLL